MKNKPSLFIGSSSEGTDVAYAIQMELNEIAEITVWNQGVFSLSNNYLSDLFNALENFNFAILVFTPDDSIEMRDMNIKIPRDNVIFETGLFMGKLGRERVFFVTPQNIHDFHMLSDLAGICYGKYDPNRSDHNLRAALGPFCYQIRQRINQLLTLDKKENNLKSTTISDKNTLFDKLVKNQLELICKAICIPKILNNVDVRMFVFIKQNNKLVCRHFWAINPINDPEGKVSFDISEDWSEKIIVVKSVLKGEIIAQEVETNAQKQLSSIKNVSEDITYVVSSPIFNSDRSIWGAVAVDTLTNDGKNLLKNKLTVSTIFMLSKQFELLFTIESNPL